MRALAPFAPLIVLWRLIAGKEERGRLTERFGFYTQERPPGRLIWLHGASVGELKVLQVLHRELRTLAADASFRRRFRAPPAGVCAPRLRADRH
jgi:3-deoxy-D-manno-octulosonic-acid transferase